MTLSPFEIERREFGKAPFGYRRGEVDEFIHDVRLSVSELWQERSELREEVERLGERVARFTALEEQLKNTLLLAQDSAEKATEQARRESELVLREAGQKAREIVHASHQERQRIQHALNDLEGAERETRQRFRALAQAVLQHLDDTEDGVATGSQRIAELVRTTAELDREMNIDRAAEAHTRVVMPASAEAVDIDDAEFPVWEPPAKRFVRGADDAVAEAAVADADAAATDA